MLIRPATPADLPAIFEIYDREVLHGTATFDTQPKTARERADWLDGHAGPRSIALVAELNASGPGPVVGWGSLSPWSTRCAYARAAENSVYVSHDARGRGVGAAILADLIRRGAAAGLGVLLARVVEGNPASLRLHESAGFRRVGLMSRVGEKFGRVLSVHLLERHLDGWSPECRGDGGSA